MNGDFRESGFIRESGAITFQERTAEPGDFTAERGYSYAAEFQNQTTVFYRNYPAWQSFADCFVMRRAVIDICGKQRCRTASFNASDLKKFRDPGFQDLKNFRIPGSDRSSVPDGKYQLMGLSFQDEGNQITLVRVHYQQFGKWELIRLADRLPLPSGTVH